MLATKVDQITFTLFLFIGFCLPMYRLQISDLKLVIKEAD
jgi:hypothetical protein